MIKGYGMKVSDDIKILLDHWVYLDQDVINMEIFYYNVPIDEADIQDDKGNIQGISVGDLLRLQPLFKEILGFSEDNKLIFYALKPLFNEYHQGLIFATDFSFNPYVFIVDNVELAYSMLYQKMGIAKLEYQKGYLKDNLLTPSCASVIDLVEALKNGEYLPKYVIVKYAKNNITEYSLISKIIPVGPDDYTIDLPHHIDFKKVAKKMEEVKKV